VHQPQTILLNEKEEQILLTPFSIINTGYLVGHHIHASPEDRVALVTPLNNASGLSLGYALAVTHRTRLDLLTENFDATKLVELLKLHQSSILVLEPSQLAEILSLEKRPTTNFPHLKTILVTANPNNRASLSLLTTLSTALPSVNIFVTFGTNETSGVFAISKQNQFTDNFIGQPLAHSEVKIVDTNNKPVKENEVGKLYVKGFNVMHSLKNNPDLTKKKIINGWLNTGLNAQQQNDGLVVLFKD